MFYFAFLCFLFIVVFFMNSINRVASKSVIFADYYMLAESSRYPRLCPTVAAVDVRSSCLLIVNWS